MSICFFLLLVIYTVFQAINTNIEKIKEPLSDKYSWILVVISCLFIYGLLSFYFRKKIKNVNEKLFESNNKIVKLNNEVVKLNNEVVKLNECISAKDLFYESMIKFGDVPVKHLTELVADFKLVQYDISYRYLKNKNRPALSEALRINELKKMTKLYYEQYKQMTYKYEILLGLFPELSTYVEDFESIKELNDFMNLDTLQDNYDKVRDYTSKEEYNKLTTDEKIQLALNRYLNGKKSKWQIGRDYEMYVAFLYQSKGWSVEQFGIEKKLEDMGRDLIVSNSSEILIIQCKYWSETKLIHEKHIAQLYGSTIEYSLNLSISKGNRTVNPVFVTNINLSETAERFAKTLNVKIIKIDMGSFPRIKCNINNNEKIYHLPFDQQYDRTKIENKGEFYASSIKEAVDAGFRRALRFYGN